MEKKKLLIFEILIALFLISQYEIIVRQNNFLAMASYILILLLLCIDFLSYTYKTIFKRNQSEKK
jgi:hypothetical protein